MTDEEIIQTAGSHWARTRGTMDSYLKMVIKLAREDEREMCAQVCETRFPAGSWERPTKRCAEAIRARGAL